MNFQNKLDKFSKATIIHLPNNKIDITEAPEETDDSFIFKTSLGDIVVIAKDKIIAVLYLSENTKK